MKNKLVYKMTMEDISDIRKFNSHLEYQEQVNDLLDLNEDLGISWSELGITENDLNDVKYQYSITEEEDNDKFNKQEFRLINMYKYVSDEYGSSEVGNNSRGFCRKLVARTKLSAFRFEDIFKITPNKGLGLGGSDSYSVFKYRGGSNCKHYWRKYKYDTQERKLVQAPIDQQPVQINKGSV